MVAIKAFSGLRPRNPEKFCIKPYDVIGEQELKDLRENPDSSIHIILPEDEGNRYEDEDVDLRRDPGHFGHDRAENRRKPARQAPVAPTGRQDLVHHPEDQEPHQDAPYPKGPGCIERQGGKSHHGQDENGQKKGVNNEFFQLASQHIRPLFRRRFRPAVRWAAGKARESAR